MGCKNHRMLPLVIDLGGIHKRKTRSIALHELADRLDLRPGGTYNFDVFFAHRHRARPILKIKLIDILPDSSGCIRQTDGREQKVVSPCEGTEGNDLIVGTPSADTIDALGGHDRINAGDGNDNVDAGDGDDIVVAGNGDDTVFGEDGNDLIEGGEGSDCLDGGKGDDVIYTSLVARRTSSTALFLTRTPAQVDEDFDALQDSSDTAGEESEGRRCDNVIPADIGTRNPVRGGPGRDRLCGGDGQDILRGKGGDDVLHGRGSRDKLRGGPGNDFLSGGTGRDDCRDGRSQVKISCFN